MSDPERASGNESAPGPEASDAEVPPGSERTGDGPGSDPSQSDPPDATLGGYFEVHTRPPAFDGTDGQPYSVSIEVEKVPSLTAPWAGYLVYPRWAETGVGIVGHVETPILWEKRSKEAVLEAAGSLPLGEVKRLLDEAIGRRDEEED